MTLFCARRWAPAALLALCALSLLSACASFNARPANPEQALWQGRLAVNIASSPAQAFSANFVLEGSPSEGALELSSLLGMRVATLRWSAHAAMLQTPQESLQFDSVDAMVAHSLGTALPMAALFGWLQGDALAPPGWEVDLQDLPAGRLRARRLAPAPAADIKIILEPR